MANKTLPKLWLQVVQTSGARTYALLIGLVSVAISSRYLGPEGRGIYAAAIGWASLFFTFGYLSLPQVIIYLAAGRKREDWFPPVVGTILVLVAGLAAFGWIAAFIGFIVTNGTLFGNVAPLMLVLALAALPQLIWLENSTAILQALDSLSIVNVLQTTGASLNLLLVFVLVALVGWGVVGALVAVLITQSLMAAASLTYILRHPYGIRLDLRVAKQLLTGGAKLHFNAIGTFLFTQASILIINHFRAPAETAYYQLAVQLISAIQVIPIAVSMVAYTVVTNKGPDQAWPEHRQLLAQALALVFGVAFVAYFFAPLGIRIVAGSHFAPAVPLFRLLLLATIGMTFSTVMASQWIARGLFIQAAGLTVAFGFLSFSATFILVPRYGMFGAAWASVLTYAVSVAGNGLMALWIERRWRRSQRSSV